MEMGFSRNLCERALSSSNSNLDEATDWLLTHSEELSSELVTTIIHISNIHIIIIIIIINSITYLTENYYTATINGS